MGVLDRGVLDEINCVTTIELGPVLKDHSIPYTKYGLSGHVFFGGRSIYIEISVKKIGGLSRQVVSHAHDLPKQVLLYTA